MDRLEALRSLAAEAARGELVFPTSARMALKLRQVLESPNYHSTTATHLIQAEPLLAARAVAVANSAAYNRGGRPITDVRTAVDRLGFRNLRWLAMALVARQMLGILARPEEHAVATQLWEHTAHVAALARVIAHRVTRQDPETAMFAGIVHEIGGFYLLSRFGDTPALAEIMPAEWEEHGEREIGRAVLRVLATPEPIMAAIENFWRGDLASPPQSLSDTLLLAEELTPLESPLRPLRHGNASPVPAVLATVAGGEALPVILAESREEVESLLAALRF